MPSSMSLSWLLMMSSRKRLTWRALRATSDMPFCCCPILPASSWEEDVVFFKAEQTGGIMHQHIRVEHKQLGDRVVLVIRFLTELFLPALWPAGLY